LYVSLIPDAERHLTAGYRDRGERTLDRCPDELRNWEWNFLKRWSQPDAATLGNHPEPVLTLAIRPDGSEIASGGADGTVRISRWGGSAEPSAVLNPNSRVDVESVTYSGDGRLLVAAFKDMSVTVWDAATRKRLSRFARAGIVGGGPVAAAT